MNYYKAIRYLESFVNYEKISSYPYKESFKLERVKCFLKTIDNPQDSLRCIHIAGSKGKGSICAFIAYILREAGFKTGLYTSPHLSDFRERIRILDPAVKPQDDKNNKPQNDKQLSQKMTDIVFEGMISKRELSGLVEKLKPAIDKYNKTSRYGPLSFFEVYTALAFVYFKQKKTDFVVLETGLGGRLDATNTVDSLVSVITPVSYEHMDKLGNTLKEIAAEKAGIIKKSKIKNQRLIVISAPQEKEALQVIRDRCRNMGAELREVGKDIVVQIAKAGSNKGRFSVKGALSEYKNLKINLIGGHQVINAVTAIAAVETLQPYGVFVSANAIKNGLYNTVWPGRCEVVSKGPLIVLDGAQNAASMRALKNALAGKFEYKELILVLGVSSDKDIAGICAELRDFADKIILTRSNNPRAYAPEELVGFFPDKDCDITMTVEDAVKLAQKKCAKQGLILITGSLFVVAQARSYILKRC